MNETPVTAAPEVLTDLDHQSDILGTAELGAYAREQGVIPPDDEDNWRIVRRYGPDGDDLGLWWIQPVDIPGRVG